MCAGQTYLENPTTEVHPATEVQPETKITAGLPPLALKLLASSFLSSTPPTLQLREDDASGSNHASVLDDKSTKR
ncbi:hypothetical protein U1Q18_003784 [Sarracenia purpurea var. burkii]